MSQKLKENYDYQCLMDLETNPNFRLGDRIRSSLLQLDALQNDLSSTVYNERLKDLLKQYSQEIDRPEEINSFINLSLNICKKHCDRPFGVRKWKSGLKKKMDDGSPIENLLPSINQKFKSMSEISNKFKEFNQNRLIKIRLPESTFSKATISSSKSIASPNRVPGLSKNNKHSNFTRSLFAKTTDCSSQSSENSQNSIISVSSQKPIIEIEEIEPKIEKVEAKKSFITGLEKHLTDKILKNELNKDEAKKIIEEVRNENSKSTSSLFKDPKKKNNSSLAQDDSLQGIEPAIIELIENGIIQNLGDTNWDNIAGLKTVKSQIQQVAVMPLSRPDIFTGIRAPPNGILLFGPPGTGKTMLGRCVASQAKATFFSITSSSLTSKWIGDGEKAIKAMFQVARCRKPSVIFIDEIDSLLKKRSDEEHESSRRMKTEFLSQFDGLSNQTNDRLLVIGTTNRPQELDEAVRRRFAVRLYIPLPEKLARKQIILDILKKEKHSLDDDEINEIAEKTEGFSGSDMKNLCTAASMYSITEIAEQLAHVTKDDIRAINFGDFQKALVTTKPSLSQCDLENYELWNKKFGS